MPEPIRKILVVGGGTAGWLSAAYLQRALPETVSITLVESDRIAPVGVGEATIPTLGKTMSFLGFSESDWMPQVGATYKAAIRFVNWSKPSRAGEITSYWHPFGARPVPTPLPYAEPFFPIVGNGFSLLHYALKRRLDGSPQSIAEMLVPGPAVCAAGKSPRHRLDPSANLATAFHIDAGAFAGFLKQVAMERGVKRVVDHVTEVNLRTPDRIASVRTAKGLSLEADLFIDCTGFRAKLIGEALGEPFLSDADRLLVDRAVAIGIKSHPEQDGLEPFTTSTALDHGWSWNIPLMERTGCGYVYSANFTTPEAAEQELRNHLGKRADGVEARHLRMRVGRSERMWAGNCLAIGLSGSFLEPLESTGIFLVEYGLSTFVNLFPDLDFEEAITQEYNQTLTSMYEEARDFVLLHYLLSDRDDTPFWRAAHSVRSTGTLKRRMAFYEKQLPAADDTKALFQSFSYACILDGYGRVPIRPHAMLEQLGYEAGFEMLDQISARTHKLVQELPDNYQQLRAMYGDD